MSLDLKTYSMKNKHEPCVRLIYEVFCKHESYILLVKNKNGKKGFPTVSVRSEESLQNAVLREIPIKTSLAFLKEELSIIHTHEKDFFFCVKKHLEHLPKLNPKKVSAFFVLKQVCKKTITTGRQKKLFHHYIKLKH